MVTSVAGTRGLGSATAYSASKRLQNTYLDALSQLSRMRKLRITFTDIRPGFVATDLLNKAHHYPMLMPLQPVARKVFRAIERRRRRVVIDWRFAVLVFFWRLIPAGLWRGCPCGLSRMSEICVVDKERPVLLDRPLSFGGG